MRGRLGSHSGEAPRPGCGGRDHSLQKDVRRAVPPAGLQAKGQPAIGLLLEAIVREQRPRGVATESLEASAVARGDGDLGMQAHAAVLEGVEMNVQVQRGAEALDERHGAALLGTQAAVPPNAPAQLREERSQEHAEDLARQAGVVGAPVARA